ncbi:MAG: hypothetical protein KJT03_20750, partial [Verrucomicrobiae bacterium]|nr:hypothetical protein [Verrucomicrobiae bacterium]
SVALNKGVLENLGSFVIAQPLSLSESTPINASSWTLEITGSGSVMDSGDPPSSILNEGGVILKTDDGDTSLSTKIDFYGGSIETKSGNLELTGEVNFVTDSKISVSEGANLQFTDNQITAKGLRLTGKGDVSLNSEMFRVSGPVLNSGRMYWKKGRFVTGDDLFSNTGLFAITNPSNTHELSGNLYNDGFVRLDEEVDLKLTLPMSLIENRAAGTLYLTGLITGTNWILDNQGLLQLNGKADSWELLTGQLKNTGTVQALETSRSTLRRVQQAVFSSGATGHSLLDGKWIAEDNSVMTLTDVFDAESKFGFIAEPVVVTIHGSGKINNLPPSSDQADVDFFSIAGELNLLDGANWSGSNLELATASTVPPGSKHYGGSILVDSNSSMEVTNLGLDSNGAPIPGFVVMREAVATVDGKLKVHTNASFGDLNPEISLRNGGMIQGNGTLTLTIRNDGGITRPGTCVIEKSNRCGLAGSIKIEGNVKNYGKICPGRSPGTITIQGDYQQSADGLLEVEIEEMEEGFIYDQLVVSGTASLGGTLFVRFSGNPETSPMVYTPILAA